MNQVVLQQPVSSICLMVFLHGVSRFPPCVKTLTIQRQSCKFLTEFQLELVILQINILTNSTVRCFGLLNSICYQSLLLIKLESVRFHISLSQLLLNLLFFPPAKYGSFHTSAAASCWSICVQDEVTGLSGNALCERLPYYTTLRVS